MIFSTCNQYSIKGIFLILLLMISTTFIQAQKADLSFSIPLIPQHFDLTLFISS